MSNKLRVSAQMFKIGFPALSCAFLSDFLQTLMGGVVRDSGWERILSNLHRVIAFDLLKIGFGALS